MNWNNNKYNKYGARCTESLRYWVFESSAMSYSRNVWNLPVFYTTVASKIAESLFDAC